MMSNSIPKTENTIDPYELPPISPLEQDIVCMYLY